MHCIVGLGNPEPRYSLTRHNVGFQIVDSIAYLSGISFVKKKELFLSAAGIVGGRKVLLVKPVTYMNRSGIAVGEVIRYYKIPLTSVLIVLDDIDLTFGMFRYRTRGNDAGNRGMKSIIRETGSDEIPRFRFGIRNRKTIANASSYVLSNFTRREQEQLPKLLSIAEQSVEKWISDGITDTMNEFNRQHLINQE